MTPRAAVASLALALATGTLGWVAKAWASTTLPPTGARYTLSVRLDVNRHLVDAEGTIVWQNPSTLPTQELWFSLFPNAFRDADTLFMRQPPALRRSGRSLGTPGSIVVSRLSSRSFPGTDLLASLAPHSPSDPADGTDICLTLPRPLAPGETIELSLAFRTQLPLMVERSGYSGTFHAVTQWFPKLARLETDGTWDHFAFHPLSEFSGEFADYDVTIETDDSYRIAAPAPSTTLPAPPGKRRERIEARAVSDFAWFAWDRFALRQVTLDGIAVRLFFPEAHQANADLSLEALAFGLRHLQGWLGPYPYPTLTVVHPPDDARPSAAMEYPSLFTTGGPWFLAHLPVHALGSVVLHELSHQWFQGMLASDEVRFPFLDEGLASFAESETLTAWKGEGSAVDFFPLRLSDLALRRYASLAGSHRGPLLLPAREFGSFPELSRRIYGRSVSLLSTIGAVFGPSRLASALSDYARAAAFTHPTPDVLLGFVESRVGRPAAQALRTAFDSDGWVDFVLSRVESRPLPNPTPARGLLRHQITVERRGNLVFPVTIALELADGRTVSTVWDAAGPRTTWVVDGAPLVAAIVDPQHQILIDDDWTNQNFRATPAPPPWRLWTILSALSSLVTGEFGT
jgi:hypothetical protein